MYPYGSGYPPNNNAPYPPNPAYLPNPGYPTQQAPYPNASPFPGGAPFGAGYPQNPNTPAYGINPPQGGSPYPPGGNSAYPPTGNSAYPPTGGSAYPSSSPYPGANPPYHETPSQYPTQNQSVPQYGAGYPPSQSQQPPYPGAGGAYGAPQYPPSSTNTTAPYPGQQQNPSPYPQLGGGQGGAQPYGYHGEQQQSATNMAQCFTEMKGHVQTIRTEHTKGSNYNGTPYSNAPLASAPFGAGYIEISNKTPSHGGGGGNPPALPSRNSLYSATRSFNADNVYETIPFADEDYSPTKNSNRNSKIGFDMPQSYSAKPDQSYQQYGRQNEAQRYRFEEEQAAKNMPLSFSNMRGYVRNEHKNLVAVTSDKKPMNILSSLIGNNTMNYVQNNQNISNVPAVTPASNFDPSNDAKVLRKAMKGFGTDEKTIINIFCNRSNDQRQQIQKVYKTQFGRDLTEDIKSETSGNFQNLLVALLVPTWDYRLKIIYEAIKGLGTDEDALIEFLLGYTNREILTINQLYYDKYKRTLEEDVVGDTSGHFKRLLISTLVGGREEDKPIDYDLARREAGMLLQAGELKVGTDESVFNMVFSRRSYDQIRITDEAYNKMTGHSLEKAIESEFSGFIKDGLLAILHTAHNRAEYFATRLHKSMVGLGTTDKQLIRIIVSRSEIDLINIKQAFQQKYGKSLKSWIKGDTSGDYKTCLLTLIREA